MDHITNQEVLARIVKEKELLIEIKLSKLEYLGHIIRNNQRHGLLQQLTVQRKVDDREDPKDEGHRG